MRFVFQTTAFFALTSVGCMSSSAKNEQMPIAEVDKAKENSIATPVVEATNETTATINEGKAEAQDLANSLEKKAEIEKTLSESKAEQTKLGSCGGQRANLSLPLFIKESPALLIDFEEKCKDENSDEAPVKPKLTALGVSCTGGPGFVTRKGHSNQNWEVISFKMDLSCPMRSQEELKTGSKKVLGLTQDPFISAFVPLMIEFWEFEQNSDAGLSTMPALTAAGGGAKQWNSGIQKNVSFPIKLYGHSSSWGKDASIYEARVIIHPRPNQWLFDVTVQDMKKLSSDEIQAARDRCQAKTGQKSACNDAFATAY